MSPTAGCAPCPTGAPTTLGLGVPTGNGQPEAKLEKQAHSRLIASDPSFGALCENDQLRSRGCCLLAHNLPWKHLRDSETL